MFGKNKKLPPIKDDGNVLEVHSVFYTIQGEGPNSGTPAVFVRLAGCNLACHFCDTDFDEHVRCGVGDIINQVKNLAPGCKLVVVTGGEPFRQNIKNLCESLIKQNYQVQIETNGTIYRDLCHKVQIVCSPKFQNGKTYNIDHRFFGHPLAFKFIVNQDSDQEVEIYKKHAEHAEVYVQPMDEYDPVVNQKNMEKAVELALKHNFKLSLQCHKIIGVA